MRLIGFATIVVLILIGLVYLMIRPIFAQRERLKDASKAKWKAYTTPGYITVVGVNLVTPKGIVLQKQEVDKISAYIDTYENDLLAALDKARMRAQTLNIQREID